MQLCSLATLYATPEIDWRCHDYYRLGEDVTFNPARWRFLPEALDDLRVELEDRFGVLPPPVLNLLFQLRVKQLALEANVDAIVAEGDQVSIRLGGLAHVDRRALQDRLGHDVRVSRTAVWVPRSDDATWQGVLLEILERLVEEPVFTPET